MEPSNNKSDMNAEVLHRLLLQMGLPQTAENMLKELSQVRVTHNNESGRSKENESSEAQEKEQQLQEGTKKNTQADAKDNNNGSSAEPFLIATSAASKTHKSNSNYIHNYKQLEAKDFSLAEIKEHVLRKNKAAKQASQEHDERQEKEMDEMIARLVECITNPFVSQSDYSTMHLDTKSNNNSNTNMNDTERNAFSFAHEVLQLLERVQQSHFQFLNSVHNDNNNNNNNDYFLCVLVPCCSVLWQQTTFSHALLYHHLEIQIHNDNGKDESSTDGGNDPLMLLLLSLSSEIEARLVSIQCHLDKQEAKEGNTKVEKSKNDQGNDKKRRQMMMCITNEISQWREKSIQLTEHSLQLFSEFSQNNNKNNSNASRHQAREQKENESSPLCLSSPAVKKLCAFQMWVTRFKLCLQLLFFLSAASPTQQQQQHSADAKREEEEERTDGILYVIAVLLHHCLRKLEKEEGEVSKEEAAEDTTNKDATTTAAEVETFLTEFKHNFKQQIKWSLAHIIALALTLPHNSNVKKKNKVPELMTLQNTILHAFALQNLVSSLFDANGNNNNNIYSNTNVCMESENIAKQLKRSILGGTTVLFTNALQTHYYQSQQHQQQQQQKNKSEIAFENNHLFSSKAIQQVMKKPQNQRSILQFQQHDRKNYILEHAASSSHHHQHHHHRGRRCQKETQNRSEADAVAANAVIIVPSVEQQLQHLLPPKETKEKKKKKNENERGKGKNTTHEEEENDCFSDSATAAVRPVTPEVQKVAVAILESTAASGNQNSAVGDTGRPHAPPSHLREVTHTIAEEASHDGDDSHGGHSPLTSISSSLSTSSGSGAGDDDDEADGSHVVETENDTNASVSRSEEDDPYSEAEAEEAEGEGEEEEEDSENNSVAPAYHRKADEVEEEVQLMTASPDGRVIALLTTTGRLILYGRQQRPKKKQAQPLERSKKKKNNNNKSRGNKTTMEEEHQEEEEEEVILLHDYLPYLQLKNKNGVRRERRPHWYEGAEYTLKLNADCSFVAAAVQYAAPMISKKEEARLRAGEQRSRRAALPRDAQNNESSVEVEEEEEEEGGEASSFSSSSFNSSHSGNSENNSRARAQDDNDDQDALRSSSSDSGSCSESQRTCHSRLPKGTGKVCLYSLHTNNNMNNIHYMAKNGDRLYSTAHLSDRWQILDTIWIELKRIHHRDANNGSHDHSHHYSSQTNTLFPHHLNGREQRLFAFLSRDNRSSKNNREGGHTNANEKDDGVEKVEDGGGWKLRARAHLATHYHCLSLTEDNTLVRWDAATSLLLTVQPLLTPLAASAASSFFFCYFNEGIYAIDEDGMLRVYDGQYTPPAVEAAGHAVNNNNNSSSSSNNKYDVTSFFQPVVRRAGQRRRTDDADSEENLYFEFKWHNPELQSRSYKSKSKGKGNGGSKQKSSGRQHDTKKEREKRKKEQAESKSQYLFFLKQQKKKDRDRFTSKRINLVHVDLATGASSEIKAVQRYDVIAVKEGGLPLVPSLLKSLQEKEEGEEKNKRYPRQPFFPATTSGKNPTTALPVACFSGGAHLILFSRQHYNGTAQRTTATATTTSFGSQGKAKKNESRHDFLRASASRSWPNDGRRVFHLLWEQNAKEEEEKKREKMEKIGNEGQNIRRTTKSGTNHYSYNPFSSINPIRRGRSLIQKLLFRQQGSPAAPPQHAIAHVNANYDYNKNDDTCEGKKNSNSYYKRRADHSASSSFSSPLNSGSASCYETSEEDGDEEEEEEEDEKEREASPTIPQYYEEHYPTVRYPAGTHLFFPEIARVLQQHSYVQSSRQGDADYNKFNTTSDMDVRTNSSNPLYQLLSMTNSYHSSCDHFNNNNFYSGKKEEEEGEEECALIRQWVHFYCEQRRPYQHQHRTKAKKSKRGDHKRGQEEEIEKIKADEAFLVKYLTTCAYYTSPTDSTGNESNNTNYNKQQVSKMDGFLSSTSSLAPTAANGRYAAITAAVGPYRQLLRKDQPLRAFAGHYSLLVFDVFYSQFRFCFPLCPTSPSPFSSLALSQHNGDNNQQHLHNCFRHSFLPQHEMQRKTPIYALKCQFLHLQASGGGGKYEKNGDADEEESKEDRLLLLVGGLNEMVYVVDGRTGEKIVEQQLRGLTTEKQSFVLHTDKQHTNNTAERKEEENEKATTKAKLDASTKLKTFIQNTVQSIYQWNHCYSDREKAMAFEKEKEKGEDNSNHNNNIYSNGIKKRKLRLPLTPSVSHHSGPRLSSPSSSFSFSAASSVEEKEHEKKKRGISSHSEANESATAQTAVALSPYTRLLEQLYESYCSYYFCNSNKTNNNSKSSNNDYSRFHSIQKSKEQKVSDEAVRRQHFFHTLQFVHSLLRSYEMIFTIVPEAALLPCANKYKQSREQQAQTKNKNLGAIHRQPSNINYKTSHSCHTALPFEGKECRAHYAYSMKRINAGDGTAAACPPHRQDALKSGVVNDVCGFYACYEHRHGGGASGDDKKNNNKEKRCVLYILAASEMGRVCVLGGEL